MEEYYFYTEGLTVGYHGVPLIKNIKISLKKGEILTLIGPNGAGKTTILRSIIKQLKPLGGVVVLDGKETEQISGKELSRKLSVVLTERVRPEMMTCKEVVATGRYPYTGKFGVLSKEDWKLVDEAMELVHIHELADRDFSKTSDGQKQRVMLARAICQQPDIIILDEPTSFLDVKGKIELLTILQKLAHERGLAVIVSLHELDMAQKIADAVVCVSPHGVSAPLTPKEAFAPENIRALYSLTKEQYEAVFGPEKPAGPKFEHYVRSGQKLLRCGYTTGTCAALGAAGAARLLLTGHAPESVALRTPKGIVVEVAPLFCRAAAEGAECRDRRRRIAARYHRDPHLRRQGRGPGDQGRAGSAGGGSCHQPCAPADDR